MPLLAISEAVVFTVGAFVSVFVLWAAFALALSRFKELADRSESGA